jgi:hypothetical protein
MAVTFASRDTGLWCLGKRAMRGRGMDTLSKRTTVILAAVFLLAGLGWWFAVQAMAHPVNAPFRCSCHSGIITCAPAAS